MKNLLKTFSLVGVFLFCIVSSLEAQTTVEETKYMSGGFGHFFFGPAYYKTPQITDYLKKADVLGSDYSPSPLSYSIGGEGGGMFERFYVGGGGFGVVSPASSTELGTANINLGGGFFKAGYKFYEKKNAFAFAYASFGGSGYTIELSNLSDSVFLNFNHKAPIAPSEKKDYTVGGFLLDLGVSIKTFPLSKMSETTMEIGGFILGIDAGVHFILPVSEWRTGEHVVAGPPDFPQLACPYLHLTIGGGGFGYEKK